MICIEVEKNKKINYLFIGAKHLGNKHEELEILLLERWSGLICYAVSQWEVLYVWNVEKKNYKKNHWPQCF